MCARTDRVRLATTWDGRRRNGGFFGRTAVHPCKADDHERITSCPVCSDEEFAVFEFGRVVHDVKDASGFSLLGFDSNARVKASDARLGLHRDG